MQEGLVSVVVPIYKTEKFLDRCISSIVHQTYINLEIILVDDGSPDYCPQMCDEWAKKDNRIRVVHKQNAGLGMARNTGIEQANGEYICFFDSDDFIAEETIDHAYAAAKRNNADIVVFGFSTVNTAGEVYKHTIPKPVKTVYCAGEVQTEFLPDLISTDPKTGVETNLWMSACMCLISTCTIKKADWRFESERRIISEDVYSLLALYKYVGKVAILKEALYYVQENPDSLTRSFQADRFERIKNFYIETVKLCCECGYSKKVERRCAEPFIYFMIGALKQDISYYKKYSEAYDRIRMTVDDDMLQHVLAEKRGDAASFSRKLLFWAMRRKLYALCYCLFVIKIRMIYKRKK